MSDLLQRARGRAKFLRDQGGVKSPEIIEGLIARVEELEAENFTLAAGQCGVPGGLVGDEHGNFHCSLQRKLQQQ